MEEAIKERNAEGRKEEREGKRKDKRSECGNRGKRNKRTNTQTLIMVVPG